MRTLSLISGSIIIMMTAAPAAELTAQDVMLKIEVEHLSLVRGLTPATYEGITGMVFAPQSVAAGALNLAPGDYTLLVECYAPAGNADGFFVELNGKQTRRTAPIGKWGTLAFPFSLQVPGLSFSLLGQEPGMTVDAIAIVRGTHRDNDPRLAQVPGAMATGLQINMAEVARLTLNCQLAELPQAPCESDEHTVYLQSFDAPVAGVSGDHHWGEGRFGQALYLDAPDGRFAVDVSALELREQGTVEWWVRPRPAQELWSDQGWHYFLHARARDGQGLQLDLSRHPLTHLRLVASSSEGPYYTADATGTREWLQLDTRDLAEGQWHHLLVSWDLSGEREHLWLLVDGVGKEIFFPKHHATSGFSVIEFGNTPSHWDVPYLPMDGAIDEVRIQKISVAERLAR